ncbi:hypothetical protein GCM10022255_103220 [Dactylosporangium darangshiense]|uniref:Uncharacterized protein n=1 Tax=Dactylosporangium darangshiense TaxID=579108 RepID=A0ABP8DSP9_9ACTN
MEGVHTAAWHHPAPAHPANGDGLPLDDDCHTVATHGQHHAECNHWDRHRQERGIRLPHRAGADERGR